MPTYKTGFVILDVLQSHRDFQQAILVLRRAALNPRLRGPMLTEIARVEAAYSSYQRRLEQLALDYSVVAEKEIREQITKTAKRPDTGLRPHLRDNIVCRPTFPGVPLPTGWVGVADIDELDKVVNPLTPGYGPYWRTQEDGSTAHVGRSINGLFFPSGGPSGGAGAPPDPGQFRAHPVFVAGPGGRGVIARPIEARHFIRKGKEIAGRKWLTALKTLEAQTMAQLVP